MIDLYSSNCAKCHENTPHRVFQISRRRGIKLQCCSCGYIKKRYDKANLLTKFNPIENRNTYSQEESNKNYG
jgi:uncharacterized Zn finger protein